MAFASSTVSSISATVPRNNVLIIFNMAIRILSLLIARGRMAYVNLVHLSITSS